MAGGLLGLVTGSPLLAASPFDATPDDNTAVIATQSALMTAHVGGVIGGVAAPSYLGTGFEMAALAADLSLKNTPPTLELPTNLEVFPNAPATGDLSGFSCVYKFGSTIRPNQDIDGDGYIYGVEESFASILYVPFDPLDQVFADLGTPRVYHPQADVRVRVSNPYLGFAAYRDQDAATSKRLQQRPEFPAGRHALEWEANTTMNLIMDFTLPASLIPLGIGAEHFSAKWLGKNSTKGVFIENAVGIAAEAGLIAADVSGEAAATQWYEDTLFFTAANRGTQMLTVWDTSSPYFRDMATNASPITEQVIEIQATDFGGVRFGRVENDLRNRFEAIDDCGREFIFGNDAPSSRLFTIGDGPHDVVWSAREVDGGPYHPTNALRANQAAEGENVVTFLTQRISVVDTMAPQLQQPAGFARETDQDLDLTVGPFPLGRPRVVDLADPAPVVRNNAPLSLQAGPEGRRYAIVWEAEDNQGNITVAPADDPDRYTQIVTLKPPGTNTAPRAISTAAATIAGQAVEISLSGADDDPMIDGRFDPLAFEIETYPGAGQFEAPLFPFFIDDFRLTPVGEREEGDELTRTSPLLHLADQFRLLDEVDRGAFLQDRICTPAPDSPDEVFGGVIPIDFVYQPGFVHVDDQNFYYLRDYFWACGEGTNGGFDAEPTLSKIPRLSKWTDGGDLVAMRSLYPTVDPRFDNTGLDAGFWPSERFSLENGRLWIELNNNPFRDGSIGEPSVLDYFSFASDLSDQRTHGRTTIDSPRSSLLALASDPRINVLYELYTSPLPRSFNRRRRDLIRISRYSDNTLVGESLDDIGQFLDNAKAPVAGVDIKVDSKGFVYVADPFHHRIHKLSPTVMNDAGVWEKSKYVGWMGRCRANKLNADNVPYNACDEAAQVSYGYACDDLKCEGYEDTGARLPSSLSGDQPGQFNSPVSIAIGPRDVLYVADSGNLRVQRFGPDGTFAGEVKSTGTGVNQGDEPDFIIGNMGAPEQVTVNSTSFFVMEKEPQNGDFFVHVFKTAPFYDLTDNSAKIKYVSNFDFAPTDTFTFYVDDGIARSEAVEVAIAVTRADNAPERLQARCYTDDTLDIDVPCTLDEDTEIFVRLSAYDADGFLSAGGLDSLTFEILEAPLNGQLVSVSSTDNAAVYRYVPNADFNGDDAFRFDVADGRLNSVGDARLGFTVTPIADAVVIEFDNALRAAHGFPSIVTADFSDVDEDANLRPAAVSIDWGDGVVATAGGWANSGREDLNGREISPQVDYGLGRGVLLGSHDYSSAGIFTVTAVMDNAAEEGLPPTTMSAPVTVVDVTVVGVSLASPDTDVDPDVPFPLNIVVENYAPTSWVGLVAQNVQLAFDVPEGLSIVLTDARCSGISRIQCNLGDLPQGAATTITLGGLIDLASARVSQHYELLMDIVDAGPKLADKNTANIAIAVADSDGDGTIDVDDAFASDPRYQADSDGDGLADQWERDHGLDPNVADDASADPDGDGFTLLEEFENGSFPGLAEVEQNIRGERLFAADNILEDRFGLTMSGGDLNLDGFADLVVGASTYNNDGAVFISYGSSNGVNTELSTLQPTSGEQLFGRSLAVGDWDDNGYPDVAIASNDSIAIHYNNGEILEAPDLFLTALNSGGSFSLQLMSGDIDGDSIDDLIVNTQIDAASTRLEIYGSATGGLDSPAATFTLNGMVVVSQAFGDVDGDGATDLLLGTPGISSVRGYLGVANDWTEASGLSESFQIASVAGQSQFGWSLASGGDVTGDGIDDLVVGAYLGGGNINLYSSESGYWSNNAAPPLQTVAGQPVTSLPGDTHGDQLGVSMAMGHLDTDGFADLVVGGNRAGTQDEGQIRILHGSASGFVNPQVEPGATPFDLLGHHVAIPGDLDGNGVDDVAGGASDIGTTQNTAPDGGYVQIFYHDFTAVDPNEDLDDDGVNAVLDNCPATPNTNQADMDDDGIGNACDADIDGDGFANNVDNCPRIASLDMTDSDNDLDGDICDADDDNDGVADADDAFPLDPAYNADSDSDGMPDAFETDNGLDPNDPSDAAGDLDGDGRNNLQEFEQGGDVAADDVAPVVTVPADMVVNSTGRRTPVNLGAATAEDVKDGALTPQSDRRSPFKPGRHIVAWSAADAAGNGGSALQQIDVIPQLGFVGDTLLVSEDSQSSILLALNGDAVNYPVTVSYAVSGTATDGVDYTLTAGDVVIDNSNVGVINLQTLADGVAEGDETLIITLGAPVNAIRGSVDSFQVRIVEDNLAPLPTVSIEQDGRRVTTVTQGGAVVQVSVDANDANGFDTHGYDWSRSDNLLVPQEGFEQATFTFDPATLAEGVYRIAVNVTDDGAPVLSAERYRYIRVVATAPVLQAGTDSDGDGIDDVEEELRDSNDNGASDYLDPSNAAHYVAARVGADAVLQTLNGYTLSLGRVALTTGDDAVVSIMDVADFGDNGGPSASGDDTRFSYPGGLFDFEIAQLPQAGHTVQVAIPQTMPIPANPVYRKYVDGEGWSDFTIDSSNEIRSAAGETGTCPAPGSSQYTPGMTTGHNCIQLQLEDGGPNDADGEANGSIRDPGGVAILVQAAAVDANGISVPNKSVATGNSDVLMLRLRLTANSSDIDLTELTLSASGSGNDAGDISNVKVWVDSNADGAIGPADVQIGSGTYGADNGELVLQMSPVYRLDAGVTELIVSYDF
ncbi:MAG: hypothetical protein GXP15_08035 [Gammaproteobacteria bacterium]|nr:hypothetical protein [Gammaproteobacteria bacterium]